MNETKLGDLTLDGNGESPEWLRDGDVVEVEIEGIGTLSNPVVPE